MGWFKKKEKKYPIELEGAYVAKGLGVPAGTPCRVKLTEETVSIICEDHEFVLQICNITNFAYESRIEIQSHMQPGSVLQGMIGEAAFGLPGVLMGSLPKTKEERLLIGTLMLKYRGKAGNMTIVLVDRPNSFCCVKISDEIKPKVTIIEEEPIRVEL